LPPVAAAPADVGLGAARKRATPGQLAIAGPATLTGFGEARTVASMPRPGTWAVVGSLAFALALAGCGGSSNESAGDTTTTTMTTSGGGGNERLSVESWAIYTSTAAKAKSVNTAAIKTFRKCRTLASKGASSTQLQACLDGSVSDVVTEGQKVLHTLQGLDSEVSGACSSAFTALEGYIKLYIASVNTLQSAIEGEGVGSQTGFATQLDNSQQALVRARASQAPFEATCKPA
jgi:hypothetical protein